jgi:hypothetical protein
MRSRVLYEAKIVNEMGGIEVLEDRLTEKFGKGERGEVTAPDAVMKITWHFSKVDRSIDFDVNRKQAWLDVTDQKALREIIARKKKTAKTGFDD